MIAWRTAAGPLKVQWLGHGRGQCLRGQGVVDRAGGRSVRQWVMARVGSMLFDRWSAVYDRPAFQDAIYRPVHDAVLARLTEVQREMVLDIGCGTGQLTRRLTERFPDAEVVGVDYSAGMLGEASHRVEGSANLVRADALYLPFRSASADVAVCTESFHWYSDQRRALAGLATILRPGGQPVHALTPRRLRGLLIDAGFDVVHQRRVPRTGFAPWPVLTHARLP
jgi:ubiquinone/menaquinone biosynthesis C-methylase UbiE